MKSLPTVTEVIRPFVDFSRIPADTLAAAADRGTAVHEACAVIARGSWAPPLPAEWQGYMDSFRRWFDVVVDGVLLVEERLFDHDFGYCGQIDLLVVSRDKETLLVDLKTPLSLSKSWKVQLSAYRNLVTKSGRTSDRAGSLRLSPEGGIPKMDWFEDQCALFNVFVAALQCQRYFNA